MKKFFALSLCLVCFVGLSLTTEVGLAQIDDLASQPTSTPFPDRLTSEIRWSNDGTRLAIATDENPSETSTIQIVNAETKIVEAIFSLPSPQINDMTWNADGSKLAGAGYWGFFVYDTNLGIETFYVDMDEQALSAIEWVSEASFLTGSPGADTTFTGKLWSSVDGSLLEAYEYIGTVGSIIVSPVKNLLAMGKLQGNIAIYSIDMKARLAWGNLIIPELSEISRGLTIDWNPDGIRLVAGFENGYVGVWNTERIATLQESAELPLLLQVRATDNPVPGYDTRTVRAVTFDNTGTRIASIAADGTIRTWEVQSGRMLSEMSLNVLVTAAGFSPDGRTLAYAVDANVIYVDVWE